VQETFFWDCFCALKYLLCRKTSIGKLYKNKKNRIFHTCPDPSQQGRDMEREIKTIVLQILNL
jgi:hypothetical protein